MHAHRIGTEFTHFANWHIDTNKGNVSHPLASSGLLLYLCLHPWRWVTLCDYTVVFNVPPVWPPWAVEHVLPCHRGAGGSLLEVFCTESPWCKGKHLLVWLAPRADCKNWFQDKVLGNQTGTTGTSCAFSLNTVIRAFLACSCPTSTGCQCCPWVSPRRGECSCWYHVVLRGDWFFTTSVLAFHRDQSLSQFCGQADSESKTLLLQASVCVCVWNNLEATSPPWSSLFPAPYFNAFFTSCPDPCSSKSLSFHFQRNVINHILNSKGISLIPVYSLAHYQKSLWKSWIFWRLRG